VAGRFAPRLRFAAALADNGARLGADADRHSFIVGTCTTYSLSVSRALSALAAGRPTTVALRSPRRYRKAWLFCGSDRGGQRTAFMYTLITTAKLNDVDPQAWLADVLARIADLPISRLPELLPWAWRPTASSIAA
jgi:IS66 C-terminal element